MRFLELFSTSEDRKACTNTEEELAVLANISVRGYLVKTYLLLQKEPHIESLCRVVRAKFAEFAQDR